MTGSSKGPVFLLTMRHNCLILLPFALILLSCGGRGLAPIAQKHLQSKVNEEMSTFLGVVGDSEIKDLKLIYDCDSLCIFQGHAVGKNEEGQLIKESIRYIFVKDSFVSAISGKPTYYEAVRGADYMSGKEIKDFKRKMDEGGTDLYQQYLAMGDMVDGPGL